MPVLGVLLLAGEPGLQRRRARDDLDQFSHLVMLDLACRFDWLRQRSPASSLLRCQMKLLQLVQGSHDSAGTVQTSKPGDCLGGYSFIVASFPPKEGIDDPGEEPERTVPGLAEHPHALFRKETLAKWVWQHEIHREQKPDVKRTKKPMGMSKSRFKVNKKPNRLVLGFVFLCSYGS